MLAPLKLLLAPRPIVSKFTLDLLRRALENDSISFQKTKTM